MHFSSFIFHFHSSSQIIKFIIMVPNRIWLLYLEDKYEENKRLECTFPSVTYVSNTIPQRLKDQHGKRDDKFIRTLKQRFLFTSGLGLCVHELSLTQVINTRTSCTRFCLPKQSMDKRKFRKALSSDEESLGICGCKGVED